MRQMMFSRVFPKGHPKAAEPTRFVEKVWAGLADQGMLMDGIDFGNYDADFQAYYNAAPKWHTIREGRRWKVGDFFVGKIWSGLPYRSKTITFTPPIMVAKTWNISIINGSWYWPDPIAMHTKQLEAIAKNDGLSFGDFLSWFFHAGVKKDWHGQIICWNEKIVYP